MLFGDVADEAGGDGKKNRSESMRPKTFKVRPVLDVAQVRTLEEALLATGNMNRGEALTEVCQAFLDSKSKNH